VGQTLVSAVHKLVNSIWNKDELPHQWKESIILLIHEKCDEIDCNNYRRILLRQLMEKEWEYNETGHQIFMDFKKAYDSVRSDALDNILIEY
jgi:hypothetical protein